MIKQLPTLTYRADQGEFEAHLWDAKQSELLPACRVEPGTTEEVSLVLRTLKEKECHFSIRSGGHSRIAGSSNALGGMMIDLIRFNGVELAEDKESARVGAGATWGNVYTELQKHEIMIAGGRVEDVGVGGLTMGGGLSFFSNRYGWTCDQVLEFEIVLPDATVSRVTEKSDPDLFWALRGGGNNFGVVTTFVFKTFKQKPEVWRASVTYDISQADTMLDAQYKLFTDGMANDPDAAAIFSYGWVQQWDFTGIFILLVHGSHQDSESWPAVFSDFEKIQAVPDGNSIGMRNISDITTDLRGVSFHGMRSIYKTTTYESNRDMDEHVLSSYKAIIEPFKTMNVSSIVPFAVFHPIPIAHTKAMTQRGGNPLGIANEKPLTVMQTVWSWRDRLDDDVNVKANKELFDRIETQGKQSGVLKDYLYQNYAWEDQDVFQGYGKKNFKRLQQIQRKVDPEGIFAKDGLCGGYFKINTKPKSPVAGKDEL